MPVNRDVIINTIAQLRRPTLVDAGLGGMVNRGADSLVATVTLGVFPRRVRNDSYRAVNDAPEDLREWTVATPNGTALPGDVFVVPSGSYPGKYRVMRTTPGLQGVTTLSIYMCKKV